MFIACKQPEKSKQIMQEALNVYLDAKLSETKRVDSSLILTNKALRLDKNNFSALNHKTALLFRKKDVKGLIQNTEELIKLTNKPYYLGQKGVLLEFQGDTVNAKECYSRALNQYEQLLSNNQKNFDLQLEYATMLQMANDSAKASKVFQDLKSMDLEDYQIEIIDINKENLNFKEQMLKYLKGEIGYDQLEKQ